jgi:hypothetical protein
MLTRKGRRATKLSETPRAKRPRARLLLLAFAVFTASIAGGLVATAGPAGAYSSNGVTITIGNWHCDQGGSIAWAQGITSFPSGDTQGPISGNTYSGVGVWFNRSNTYSSTVYCQGWVWKGWYWSYVRYYKYIYPYQQNFWPSYPGQHFYL